ncbi:GET complex subunit get1 [Malassezia caprae]|uniref:GET complex subunit get1 n=1 Tax=Malassezia caprae TaxID=1381934 RepID=A0AAF0E6M3_9BASI|nr:GET complex subunit get1 [Malassezia caprae]
MHPALVIFLVSLINHAITWIGRDKLQEWFRYVYMGVFKFSASSKLASMKKELFETRQQMNMTSAQDEFSKWAKLRRRVDKLSQQVDEQRFIAIPFVLNWYFKYVPMFYLPPGDWFGPLGYLFSFPNAPVGAVSSTVWTTVCGRVLALVGDYARELREREAIQEKPVQAAPHESKANPVQAPAIPEKKLDEKPATKEAESTLKRRAK